MQAFFMKQYLKIKVSPIDDPSGDMLIAELSEIGFYAFEQQENALICYIKREDFNENDFLKIIGKSAFESEIIEDKNWNEQWESDFQPVIIDQFAGIRAAFHPPLKDVVHEIVITPKMSFGTGHHATTELMIRLMEQVDFNGKTVIDFGTGTGVLAILAEKSGAEKITAIDNDDWSIANADENFKMNNCHRIELQKCDDLTKAPNADIILANINLNILATNAFSIAQHLSRSGTLLLSGILVQDADELQKTFKKKSVFKLDILKKKEWAALKFIKQ